MFITKPKWIEKVTVEPMLFLYFVTLAISALVGTNLILRKGCDVTAAEQPADLREKCLNESYAQELVAKIQTWKLTIQYSVPLVFILFAGSWSDTHGRRRRPLMFIPIAGQLLTDAFNVLNVYNWHWSPAVAAVSECLVPALTGSRICCVVGVASYVADITRVQDRTKRIGMLMSLYFIATPVGACTAGFLNVNIGFYGTFGVCIAMNVAALVLGAALVKDTSVPYDKGASIWQTVNPKVIADSVRVLVKKRPSRSLLIYMTIVSPLTIGPMQGEYSILYLFVRYKFGWNEIDYSLYAAYKMTGILIGTIVAIWLMSVKLKMHDAAIGFIGSSFDLIAAVCYSFVTQPWQLYAVPVIDIFHGAAFTVSTSMASKLVDNSELAQLNSVRGMLETLAPIIIYPLYNQLYKLTFETLPGAFFLLTAVITVPVVILFGLTYKADQKNNIFKNNEDNGVAQKNKDECNNTVKEESIKTINSV
ncbi:PREDICTED: uncharacterized protein LOC107169971 [Diuraphis noxia]|uniref:uncharacterized protein LOC107169971 n=1 Tax=Diuraphis noxia TaxID=143948 RepID=UPI000763A049|nr:PREDICTED: uncharacterized protein LOC107169971 [Diuraphis noxia]